MRSSEHLGIAYDIGTTTIAASLVDIRTGERLERAGSLNPQRQFGVDVLARLQAACDTPESLREMSRMINGELEKLGKRLLGTAGSEPKAVRSMAMAGNPAMEHLLLGYHVESLAFPPFRPLFSSGTTVHTADLGWLMAKDAFIFPLPSGFVGGDLVAFLFGVLRDGTSGSPPFTNPAPSLFIDLGTNAEIALLTGERIYATSAAAGPALEGGNLACGMAALPGAISRVKITGDRAAIATIANEPPVGICGSGVIDALAEMLAAGVVDLSGRLRAPDEIATNLANRVREIDGTLSFVLHQDARGCVYLSQQDIREAQLAKAALRAGMEILFRRAGISPDDLCQVVLTGSFGAELSVENLKRIGIFTEKMVHVSNFVRDGALAGVEKALCSPHGFAEVNRLAEMVRVIPLSGSPAFEEQFFEQMDFPGDPIT